MASACCVNSSATRARRSRGPCDGVRVVDAASGSAASWPWGTARDAADSTSSTVIAGYSRRRSRSSSRHGVWPGGGSHVPFSRWFVTGAAPHQGSKDRTCCVASFAPFRIAFSFFASCHSPSTGLAKARTTTIDVIAPQIEADCRLAMDVSSRRKAGGQAWRRSGVGHRRRAVPAFEA
jgi:hypothetical protein